MLCCLKGGTTLTMTSPMMVTVELRHTNVPRITPPHVSLWYTGMEDELNPFPCRDGERYVECSYIVKEKSKLTIPVTIRPT